jgi:DNA-binding NtrC family response regulator
MSTILIMDEDRAIRMLYAEELTEEGYNVITCGDAAMLMELISRKKPDIVLMEALLSKRDGLDLLQDISYAFQGLPVILCTAYPAFREDLRSLAAYGFVIKGSNLKPLKALIEKVIEGRPQPRSSKPFGKPDASDPTDMDPFRKRNSGNTSIFHSDKAEV